jgi:sugar transferase (PEP-CTERM system associated)
LLVLYYAVPPTYIGRGVLAIALLLSLGSAVATRLAAARLFETGTFKRRVLVLGAGDNAHTLNDRLRRRSDRAGFTLVGFVPLPGQKVSVARDMLVQPVNGILSLAEELNVAELVVALDERRGALPMEEMLICAQRGLRVTDLSSFFEREAGMVSLSVSDPSWLVFSGGFDHSLPRRLSKRFFDVVAAMSLLLISWPVMVLVALCVKLESPGPMLYRQVRVGELGQEFELVKFRSMRADAEADGVARWASRQDDRSTRVGRFIRKTRLDELPQLLNVLRGEMSFVGPRPERPQFVSMLAEQVRYYNVRHSIKPGLTGWAQVRYPYGASVSDAEEKLKFDLFYVKNHGLLLDLLILMQTIEVVLFQRGGR